VIAPFAVLHLRLLFVVVLEPRQVAGQHVDRMHHVGDVHPLALGLSGRLVVVVVVVVTLLMDPTPSEHSLQKHCFVGDAKNHANSLVLRPP